MSCLLRSPNRPASEWLAGARAAVLVSAIVACAFASVRAVENASAILNVALLQAGERASIVVELREDATAKPVAAAAGSDRVFEVEIGPLHNSIAPRRLVASLSAPLVGDVSVRGVAQPGGVVSARIQIKGRAPLTGSVRQGPHRVYIDLAPRQSSGDGRANVPAPSAPPGASSGGPAAVGTTASLPARAAPAAVGSERAGDSILKAKPETELLEEAKALASRPDVKGVERIRLELLRRHRPAGAADGAVDDPAVAEVDATLDKARRLQLEVDARKFRDSP